MINIKNLYIYIYIWYNKQNPYFFYIYKYEHNLYVYNYSKDNYWEEERGQERRNGSLWELNLQAKDMVTHMV